MAEFERITNKLETYLLKEMGFKKKDGTLTKTLKDEKDFIIGEYVVMSIINGQAYNGDTTYIYSLVEENFICEIEEKFSEWLHLTEIEQKWLDKDEDGCFGIDVVSEWIWDNVEVTCQHTKVDAFVKGIIKKVAA